MKTQRSAFTLVELSIVLVILGLLIGGVLTGQSLIRAAELRSVSTQSQQFVTATMTFRDKYFGLPGDITNATSYWGTASSCPGDQTTPSTTAATCNGNGDGKLTNHSGSNEWFRHWQHLANAGLIEGSYSGVQSSSTPAFSTSKANAPAGRISASLWLAHNQGSLLTGRADMFDGVYDNYYQFGGAAPASDPSLSILKPEEAYNIDTKLDDGKPATGKVVIRNVTSISNCSDTSTSSAMGANYLLSSSSLGCLLIFRQFF